MQLVTVDVVEFIFVAFDGTGVDIFNGTLEDITVLLLGSTVVFIDDKVTGGTEVVVNSDSTVVFLISVTFPDVEFTVVELFVIFRFADATFNGKMVNIVGSNVVGETGAAVVEDSDVVFFTEGTDEFADTVLLTIVVFVTQTVVFVTLVSCLLPSVNVETISQGTFSTSVLSFSLIFKKQTPVSLGALSGL